MTDHSPESVSFAATRRVFFAAQPGAAEREQLAEILKGFSADPATAERLRWLDPASWHVTLRFVGNVAADRVPPLLNCITQIDPFSISFTHLEPFPSARRPLVLAATGAAEDAGHALVETLEARCRAHSLPPMTRPWRPHMSFARVRGRRGVQLAPWPLQWRLRVTEFVLMESVQDPQGNRYVPIDPISAGASTSRS